MAAFAVLGIGNSLMTDDGVGVHALRRFAANNTDSEIRCLDAGTVGLALMSRLSGLDGLIAVDAMRLGKAPGTITILEDAVMDEHLRRHHGSVHELGLSDIIDALRLSGDLPQHRALVGIEPEAIDWGTEPSATVAVRIPELVESIHALLARWKATFAKETAA